MAAGAEVARQKQQRVQRLCDLTTLSKSDQALTWLDGTEDAMRSIDSEHNGFFAWFVDKIGPNPGAPAPDGDMGKIEEDLNLKCPKMITGEARVVAGTGNKFFEIFAKIKAKKNWGRGTATDQEETKENMCDMIWKVGDQSLGAFMYLVEQEADRCKDCFTTQALKEAFCCRTLLKALKKEPVTKGSVLIEMTRDDVDWNTMKIRWSKWWDDQSANNEKKDDPVVRTYHTSHEPVSKELEDLRASNKIMKQEQEAAREKAALAAEEDRKKRDVEVMVHSITTSIAAGVKPQIDRVNDLVALVADQNMQQGAQLAQMSSQQKNNGGGGRNGGKYQGGGGGHNKGGGKRQNGNNQWNAHQSWPKKGQGHNAQGGTYVPPPATDPAQERLDTMLKTLQTQNAHNQDALRNQAQSQHLVFQNTVQGLFEAQRQQMQLQPIPPGQMGSAMTHMPPVAPPAGGGTSSGTLLGAGGYRTYQAPPVQAPPGGAGRTWGGAGKTLPTLQQMSTFPPNTGPYGRPPVSYMAQPPTDGCWICGGPHYKSQCPNRGAPGQGRGGPPF